MNFYLFVFDEPQWTGTTSTSINSAQWVTTIIVTEFSFGGERIVLCEQEKIAKMSKCPPQQQQQRGYGPKITKSRVIFWKRFHDTLGNRARVAHRREHVICQGMPPLTPSRSSTSVHKLRSASNYNVPLCVINNRRAAVYDGPCANQTVRIIRT